VSEPLVRLCGCAAVRLCGTTAPDAVSCPDPRPAARLRWLLVLMAIVAPLGGCSLIGDLVPVSAPLEVFNRTEEVIFLLAADGARLDVPACGHAFAADFRVDQVQVRTELGYIKAFGYGEPVVAGRQLTLIITARTDEGFPTTEPLLDPLPPCRGHPEVQLGN
jgi:hypothetical protein